MYSFWYVYILNDRRFIFPMKTQSFNNYIGNTHEIVMSEVLGVPMNDSWKKGIDLIDSVKGVEVKGCLVDPTNGDYKKNYAKWTLFGNEVDWDEKYNGLDLYCALGTYELSVPREKLGVSDMGILEVFVSRREFWVVSWNWTLNFPISKAKYSSYRYLKPRPVASSGIPHMPEIKKTIEMKKGLLHFTKGVDLEHFNL